MNILLLAPYPPYPPRGGGALRIYNLVRGLAARHELTLLSFVPDQAAVGALAPLRELCRVATVIGPPPRSLAGRALTTIGSPLPDMALRNASRPYAAALSRLLASGRYDVVQAESIEMAGYALMARGMGPRLVLDQFNAEYLLQRRAALADLRRGLGLRPRAMAGGLYSLAQWRKLARYEARLLRELDCVLVVSEDDRAALSSLAREAAPRLAVVPNGVDTALVRPGPVRGDLGPATMAFTGTLDYRPNLDALRWFVSEALPLIRRRRADARLLVVGRAAGRAAHALAGEAVEVVGEVPDVAPYIDGAALYVVPMRIGGGSRLKLLEALAMEAPVVSTPMGVEGVAGLRDGEQLLIADSPRAFAEAALRLMADPDLGRRLGAAGRAHVAARYDWSAIIPRLEQAYASAEATRP
ncbi:MAG: glycosyltransferase [Chloroflexales bacterium]|nr:glycosyltransferase [Chloroflexales bacterium]